MRHDTEMSMRCSWVKHNSCHPLAKRLTVVAHEAPAVAVTQPGQSFLVDRKSASSTAGNVMSNDS